MDPGIGVNLKSCVGSHFVVPSREKILMFNGHLNPGIPAQKKESVVIFINYQVP